MAYPTVTGYDEILRDLAQANPQFCQLQTLNDQHSRTHEGRNVYALRITGREDVERPAVIIVGGLHAREYAPPDALLSFAVKLVRAYSRKSPIVLSRMVDKDNLPPPPALIRSKIIYPELTLPWPTVKDIVETLDLYLVPMANPDGRIASHTLKGWRSNRRPSTTGCPPITDQQYVKEFHGEPPFGVDLNRNFGDGIPHVANVLWDSSSYFSIEGERLVGVKFDECAYPPNFRGPHAGSEPETQNIQNLINRTKVRWFFDLHSKGRLILYPWGIEDNGNNSQQSFRNPEWHRSGRLGGRDGVTGDNYKEYVPDSLQKEMILQAETIKQGILRCAGIEGADPFATIRSTYTAQQAGLMHPHTGGSADYAFSRQFLPEGSGWGPVYALSLECGSVDDGEAGWHPSVSIYPKIEREVHTAIFTFLSLAVANARNSKAPPTLPIIGLPSAGPGGVR